MSSARPALRLDNERLADCDLYVTLEPCTMCAAAISFARIRRLYFGAEDVKGGAVVNGVRFFEQPTCHHAPEVYGGIAEQEASALLKDVFRGKALSGHRVCWQFAKPSGNPRFDRLGPVVGPRATESPFRG